MRTQKPRKYSDTQKREHPQWLQKIHVKARAKYLGAIASISKHLFQLTPLFVMLN